RLKVSTEKIFTVEFDIMAEYKFLDQGESSTQLDNLLSNYYNSFIQTLVDALGGSFTFKGSDDFRTPFVIQLDLPLAEDTNPNMNTKPIPLRYFIKEFEDIDPRNLLRIGMVRAHDSIVTRKALAFLHEFEMQSLKIITPNDIPSCDINVLIFDSTETTNEINETICKNAREAHVLIISITFLLKHLTICDTAQKVGLGDGEVYFVAKVPNAFIISIIICFEFLEFESA
ncbi:8700_t:CDS:2, partial [Racocetra fulgida]